MSCGRACASFGVRILTGGKGGGLQAVRPVRQPLLLLIAQLLTLPAPLLPTGLTRMSRMLSGGRTRALRGPTGTNCTLTVMRPGCARCVAFESSYGKVCCCGVRGPADE